MPVEDGLGNAGRPRDQFTIYASAFVATGASPAEVEEAVSQARREIAILASTRTYHPVLAVHGWQDLADRITALLADPDARARIGEQGRASVDGNRGALVKLLGLIEPLLDERA